MSSPELVSREMLQLQIADIEGGPALVPDDVYEERVLIKGLRRQPAAPCLFLVRHIQAHIPPITPPAAYEVNATSCAMMS